MLFKVYFGKMSILSSAFKVYFGSPFYPVVLKLNVEKVPFYPVLFKVYTGSLF